jgi:RNA polymerase sigma-70 factor (ECF subfamily)
VREAVAGRLDARAAAKINPSDLVQETLGDAVRRFPEYPHRERIGFVPWLRQLARRRVIWATRQHLGAAKRRASRDRRNPAPGGTSQGQGLLSGLASPGSSPSQRAVHREDEERLLRMLQALPELDRRILRIRYVEQRPFPEIAKTIGMGLGAVTMHRLRAVRRLRVLMEALPPE